MSQSQNGSRGAAKWLLSISEFMPASFQSKLASI